MKSVECWTTLEEIKRYFNGQEACTFVLGHYASIEIVLVLYKKKCRLNFPRRFTVRYIRSDVNLLFYSTIAVHREI